MAPGRNPSLVEHLLKRPRHFASSLDCGQVVTPELYTPKGAYIQIFGGFVWPRQTRRDPQSPRSCVAGIAVFEGEHRSRGGF